MKTFRKAVSMLLVVCMAIGCMTVSAFAANEVTTSAFGQSTYPTVSGNYADTVYAKASVDVDETVTDSGSLVLYSSYGLCTVTNWNTIGVTKVTSNNTSVATAEITYSGSTLNVAITGVSDGIATITVDYCGQTTVNSNQIYSGTNGVANGYIKYTVTVGTGSSSGGSGSGSTEPDEGSDWIKISTPDELMAIEDNMAGNYYLANDIDLAGYADDRIGTGDVAFTGTLLGCGYTISNGTLIYKNSSNYSTQNYVALFALNQGTIRDLTLDGFDVQGNSHVAVLAAENQGSIINCHVVNSNIAGLEKVTSASALAGSGGEVGSLVGTNTGLIEYCSAKDSYVGGVKWLGGLVGDNYGGTIRYSYTDSVGVMSNANSDTIIKNGNYCKQYGYTAYHYFGTFVGQNEVNGKIYDCYSYDSDVMGYSYVSGFCGNITTNGSVERCYSALSGIRFPSNKTGAYVIGGVTGDYYINYLYGVDANSALDNGGHTNLTSAQAKVASNFETYNFESVWKIDGTTNSGYPYLFGTDIVEPDLNTSTDVTVTFAAGDVREGDNVTLPTPNPVTVTVPADGKGSLVLEQDASRTSVVKGATWYYRFIGWTDGTKTYDLGDIVEVTKDITLNAVWKLYTVDGDKAWTYLDAMSIMDYLAGNVEFYPEQIDVANYDNDDSVSYLDAMAIMDVLAGTTN